DLAGREAVAGPVPLTPIQRWFMETPMPNRNRWCLTAVFALPGVPTLNRLRAAAAAVQSRHDALRVSWVMGPQGMVQQLANSCVPTVQLVQATVQNAAALQQSEDELANTLMASLDM